MDLASTAAAVLESWQGAAQPLPNVPVWSGGVAAALLGLDVGRPGRSVQGACRALKVT